MPKIQNQKNYKNQNKVERLKEAAVRHGIECHDIDEAIPFYEAAPCENVIHGKNNTLIVLGRDRPSIRSSGFGGRGGTQCGKIDLIAGLASSFSRDGPPDSDTIVNPNFALDASRIYISQRSNIDAYMGIAEAVRDSSKASAAIAIKSDCIRIVGRKNIKIVTGKARFEGLGRDGELNASGGKEQIPGTISFIAGNYTEEEEKMMINFLDPAGGQSRKIKKLQSLVKGENLIEAFEEALELIDELATLVDQNNQKIINLASSYAAHVHISTPPGFPVVPTTQIPAGLKIAMQGAGQVAYSKLMQKKTLFFKQNFLKQTGPLYINSKHVYTT